MRLIVMGQQAFGKDVLAKLLETGTDEVVAVYCEPDKDGKPADPIKEFAVEKGLPVEQPANFDDQATLDKLASFNADLMVMAFVNVFVPEAARDTPTHGSICFHPSLLPLHRGPSAVNWPIILGSTKSGYSWFYPSDGLDEGDSLLQWECEIGPDDTVIDPEPLGLLIRGFLAGGVLGIGKAVSSHVSRSRLRRCAVDQSVPISPHQPTLLAALNSRRLRCRIGSV